MKLSNNIHVLYILLFLVGYLITPDVLLADTEQNTCLECHIEEEAMPEDFMMEDVHQRAGISCNGCHGGDSTSDDMDEAKTKESGYIGVPERKDIPAFCGSCHNRIEYMRVYQPRIPTNQEARYYSSKHGKMLLKGDEEVAQCTSCHSAHKILPVEDSRSMVHPVNIPATCNQCHGDQELMAKFGHKTDPYGEYALSVHGIALLEKGDTGSPSCNDCHGNHGAAPPGAESVTHICGSCHLNNLEFFKTSKMGQSLESSDYHSCESCHKNHAIMKPTDEMLNVSGSSICMDCHEEGDDGYITASILYDRISEVDSSFQQAQIALRNIQIKGMNDINISYLLRESNQNLIQVRTMVHSFDPELITEKAMEGLMLSQLAMEEAAKEIEEFNQRRIGFGISTLAFVLLAIALYLKIKLIERRRINTSTD